MLHAGASRYMASELIPREIDAETETENEGLPFTRWSDMYAFGMSAFEVRGSCVTGAVILSFS